MFRPAFEKPGTTTCRLDLNRVEAVLFDLDGTLINVDMQLFVADYLHRLTKRLADLDDPLRVTKVLRSAVAIMLNATAGEKTMEELLYAELAAQCGIDGTEYRARFELFCEDDLSELQPLVQGHPRARNLVEACLERGWQPVLATNPIFPKEVVDARLDWGGLVDLPFAIITSYEKARFCKPHAGFFRQVAEELSVPTEACLMVGNDTQHDLSAGQYGLQTCLLTPWQIDRPGARFLPDWQGDHEALLGIFSGEKAIG